MGIVRLSGLGFVMILLGYREVSPLVCCVVTYGLRTTTTTTRGRRRPLCHQTRHHRSQSLRPGTVGARPLLSLSMDDGALGSDRSKRVNCVTPGSTSVTEIRASSAAALSDDDRFLQQVETTVDRVIQKYCNDGINVLASDKRRDEVLFGLPARQREPVGVARHLHERLQALRTNKDCRRCWLQQAHCICHFVEPLPIPTCIRTIYLLTHHKEIGLAVDTAKLILAAFADASRLVVGGIPGEYQESMNEMMDSLTDEVIPTLVLFPAEGALTLEALWCSPDLWSSTRADAHANDSKETMVSAHTFDLIVLDGTWEQARRLYNRYILPYNVTNVQLSLASLDSLNTAATTACTHSANDTPRPISSQRQLRRHPVPIREIATAHALHLLLQDIVAVTSPTPASGDTVDAAAPYRRFGTYLEVANAAAIAQLGPTRPKLR
jgi:DTW domain-containing protein YfiP